MLPVTAYATVNARNTAITDRILFIVTLCGIRVSNMNTAHIPTSHMSIVNSRVIQYVDSNIAGTRCSTSFTSPKANISMTYPKIVSNRVRLFEHRISSEANRKNMKEKPCKKYVSLSKNMKSHQCPITA